MSFPRHGEQAVNPLATAQMYVLYISSVACMCKSHISSARPANRGFR